MGETNKYWMLHGHEKKPAFIYFYDDNYKNNNLRIIDAKIKSVPNATTKSLIISFINGINNDEYQLQIRNRSGGIKLEALEINLRKKW